MLENTGIFSGLGAAIGTLAPGQFSSSLNGQAHEPDDRIIYNPLSGVLSYDGNGSAPGGAIQFAVLENRPTLTFANFIVI